MQRLIACLSLVVTIALGAQPARADDYPNQLAELLYPILDPRVRTL